MIAEPMYTPTKNEDAPIILPIMNAVVDEPAITVAKERTELAGKPLTICVKSYGDYRFINADDICYVQADNNSTDIHLVNGEMITAFKTLKHFETVLPSPFVRIHNSYIVNIDYVSRIHTGNAVCYIKNTAIKLPFSKSYKENVDVILNSITTGNYLEI
jgi:DNA-binding LytR/AlgR family response regulator